MTPERFKTLVDAYGADPLRWPDEEREAASIVARSGDPATADARRLDDLLKHWIVPPESPDALARVATAIVARAAAGGGRKTVSELGSHPVPTGLGPWIRSIGVRPLWPNVIGLAASAALGVLVGMQDTQPSADELVDPMFVAPQAEETLW